ncbi:CNNM domain-containing protein [Candidatus Synechococcus spongiarum]|uniref:Membrane associated SBC domains n=1 Tax=Candidatus Synechococcus spongiarum TaxID=431041 RepID=A0A164Z5A9_9SYNE|nr:CNNM domain-containing protein [Candidatus Synechococcus spongiarum]SAY38990.1 Membrane associated SBC domains [Candidatus Synechococcus spongiarum]
MAVALLLGSAFCSGSEAAIMTTTPLQVQDLCRRGVPGANSLKRLRLQLGRTLAAVVVINNMFNTFGSIMLGSFASWIIVEQLALPNQWLAVFSTLFTLLVIVVGEIVPKALGARFNVQVSLVVAPILLRLTRLLLPLVWILERLVPALTAQSTHITDEAEIRLLTRLGHQQGRIEADEAAMIGKVFQLNDLRASELMMPRVAAPTLAGSARLASVEALLLERDDPWWVILGEEVDHVLGVASREALLAALVQGRGECSLAVLSEPVVFVPEMIRADQLLMDFRHHSNRVRVVVDEFGGFAGVIGADAVLTWLAGWRPLPQSQPR